ncbi:MAG: hypothetical protein JRI23_11410 [Deltaproteobacteria bacterium]|nr:hypothetical protein [Deltaproteobacteria bacterium]MBW2532305.1 hypothetical protein [Deltaproteobacteria bacterium]
MRSSPLAVGLALATLTMAACLGRAALEPIGPPEDGSGGEAGTGGTGGTTGSTTTTWTTSTNTTTTTTTTTTTWPQCDGLGDCSSCAECAIVGPCEAAYDGCVSSEACLAFSDCFDHCWDIDPWDCMSQCGSANPGGYDLFYQMLDCIGCQQCPSDCWDISSWLCFWDEGSPGGSP